MQDCKRIIEKKSEFLKKRNMVRKTFLWILFALCIGCVRAQTDTLLMKVGHLPISRAEFLYAYQKHGDGEPLRDFVSRFVSLKWRVCEAQAKGLDTTTVFRQKYEACKEALALRLKIKQKSVQAKDAVPRPAYGQMAHVGIRVPQYISYERMNALHVCLDSLASAVVSEGLDCWIRVHGDSLPMGWQAEVVCANPCQLPNDLLRVYQKLKPGEISGAFSSPVGLHLIQRLKPVDESKSLSDVQEMEDVSPYLLQEYHDGLLADMLECKLLQVDEQALKKYYKKHKKHYRWKLPHFKGVALQASDREKLERLVKYLEGIPEEKWEEVVARFDSIGGSQWVKVDSGLYQIGTNDCIDKFCFGQGDFVPSAEYPYVRVLGKVLKRKPESYKDVYVRLKQDYEDAVLHEEEGKWAKKFGVEINEEALKTVNNHDAI